jgi:hypothetical protein
VVHPHDLEALRRQLASLDYGEHGLTRNDLRARIADLPDAIYLHLPDSKRFGSAEEILYEVRTSAARAEGEFIAADDNTPSDGAEAEYGPAAYGDSPLVNTGIVGPATNTPLPGFDGNSLETEREYEE